MRKLIAGMKISVDSKAAGPEGVADWVHGWSEDYGLTPQIDTCLLGAGMYPSYERYWTEIQRSPENVNVHARLTLRRATPPSVTTRLRTYKVLLQNQV